MSIDITPLKEWGLPIQRFLLVAGPCSAESEEQVFATARALSDSGISLFRAGIWKPRTHPGSFEGIGIQGLQWLQRIKTELGLSVGVEVAGPAHVEACLKHEVDVLWIGARTTPNPFAMQAIAEALRGTDTPVFVKNPVSPDIELWIGGVERLYNAGLRKIGGIHRGFTTSRKILYRNDPNWKIPIEFKRRLPAVPLICDPSHICGKDELIFSVAQEALDLLYEGLMIEVHINPATALSDSGQQLTPENFRSLISRLTVKSEASSDQDFQKRLKELRMEVDDVDEHIIRLLGKRMEIVRKMGLLKRGKDVSTLQPHRWKEIIASRVAEGKEEQLSEEFVLQMFQLIHEEAIQQQEEDSGYPS